MMRPMKAKLYNSIMVLLCLISCAIACGGGWAPYVPPSQSVGSSGKSQSSSQLYVFDKGVTYDLFDPKILQPLIRNIILTGNERKDRSSMKQVKKQIRKVKTAETSAQSDSSTTLPEPQEESKPVLYIHGMH